MGPADLLNLGSEALPAFKDHILLLLAIIVIVAVVGQRMPGAGLS